MTGFWIKCLSKRMQDWEKPSGLPNKKVSHGIQLSRRRFSRALLPFPRLRTSISINSTHQLQQLLLYRAP
ncbi:hypothetical protein L1887_21151 [Cichorium endivia]|nr:hypothetical protein L1887_21151 [Cichorium endivia]